MRRVKTLEDDGKWLGNTNLHWHVHQHVHTHTHTHTLLNEQTVKRKEKVADEFQTSSATSGPKSRKKLFHLVIYFFEVYERQMKLNDKRPLEATHKRREEARFGIRSARNDIFVRFFFVKVAWSQCKVTVEESEID